MIRVTCPRCHHEFVQQVDLGPAEFVPARMVAPESIQAKMSDSSDELTLLEDAHLKEAEPAPALEFVSARIASPPVTTPPVTTSPSSPARHHRESVPPSKPWSDELNDGVLGLNSDPFQTSQKYVTLDRPRKPIPVKVYYWIGGSLASLLLLYFVGTFAVWGFNKVGISFLPDSHERLFNECIAELEDSQAASQDNNMTQAGLESEIKRLPSLERKAEKQLLRAIRLGPVSKEKVNEFQGRIQQAMFKAAQSSPDVPLGQAQEQLDVFERYQDATRGYRDVTVALSSYMSVGIVKASEPQNDIQQIYFDDLNYQRKLLEILATTGRKADVEIERIETLADEVLKLVELRSKKPQGIDSIPTDYDAIDRSLSLVENYFANRLQAAGNRSKEVADAVQHFHFSRQLILAASRGKPFSELKQSLADARAGNGPSNKPAQSPATTVARNNPPPAPSGYPGTSSSSSQMIPSYPSPPSSDRPSRMPGMQGELGMQPNAPGSIPPPAPSRPNVSAGNGAGMISEPGMEMPSAGGGKETAPNRGRPGVSSGTGFVGEPGMEMPSAQGGNRPQNDGTGVQGSGKIVRIEISGKKKFNLQQLSKVRQVLNVVRNSPISSGRIAWIEVAQSGTFEELLAAIPFGAIKEADEKEGLIKIQFD